MRAIVREFAREAARVLPILDPVVEIGSRPAEGQESATDVRTLYDGHEFIGCDVQEGVGVDRVEDVHRLSFADDSVGTVVSFDTLEHVADPLRALQEIHRVLRPGGVAVIASVMFFPIHAHPWDFWRFTPEGFSQLLDPFEASLVMAHGFEALPESVFGVGVKGPFEGLTPALFPRTDDACRRWGEHQPVDLGPIRMTVAELWRFTLRETAAGVRRRVSRARARR